MAPAYTSATFSPSLFDLPLLVLFELLRMGGFLRLGTLGLSLASISAPPVPSNPSRTDFGASVAMVLNGFVTFVGQKTEPIARPDTEVFSFKGGIFEALLIPPAAGPRKENFHLFLLSPLRASPILPAKTGRVEFQPTRWYRICPNPEYPTNSRCGPSRKAEGWGVG